MAFNFLEEMYRLWCTLLGYLRFKVEVKGDVRYSDDVHHLQRSFNFKSSLSALRNTMRSLLID